MAIRPKQRSAETSHTTIHVVPDTNAIWTKDAHLLVPSWVRRLTQQGNSLSVRLVWNIPQIVIDERRYQMTQVATQIASNLSRAALLLPSASEFGKDKLIARVEEVIQAQIKEQEIKVVDLEVTAVDWTSLIKRAVLRHPPFEAGDKEKGFRDAIVLETFAQLHQNLRLSGPDKQVLLSNDSLLAEATHERMVGINNVLLVKTWKELETLVSAAAASLQQSAAEKLVERAGLRFQTTFPLNVLVPEISNRNVFQSAPILEGMIRWGKPQFGETALLGVGGRKVVFSTDVIFPFAQSHLKPPIPTTLTVPSTLAAGTAFTSVSSGSVVGTPSDSFSTTTPSSTMSTVQPSSSTLSIGDTITVTRGWHTVTVVWSSPEKELENIEIEDIKYEGVTSLPT
jgi:hypothetical protein